MTQKQLRATEALKRALNRCAAAGLRGGVYGGGFCVWPVAGVDPREEEDASFIERGGPRRFFELIREHGAVLDDVKMDLDGGAGV